MHLAPIIRDLAVILGVAGLISLLFQRIRQPTVLGYIIAGIIIGPYTPPVQLVTDLPSIRTWAELGVIFLMFTLGLEFSFRKLARVGGSATITAVAEVLFFLPVGFFVGKLFHWPSMDCLFLGAMLSISSTTIIIKTLDELKMKKHRFAELIFAVLIVEDLFAILLLVALSTIAISQTVSALALLTAALKLILVVGGWFITGYFVIPRFMQYIGRSGNDEMLTILSLGLCLALVVFANHFHYSTALGAFIMGSIIAESPVLSRVETSMASLRDVFGAIFFVSIGMLIDPHMLWAYKGEVAVICAVTILGKIISTSFGALVSGQSIRNSVQVGFGLAQIGEFSFIIAQLGMTLDVTSDFLYPVAVAVSLVTTFTTPYLIRVSGRAAGVLEKYLPARAKELLNRYAVHSEARRAGESQNLDLYVRPILRWSINGLTASVIFVSCSEWLLPILPTKLPIRGLALPLVGWFVAITLSSPFIWGMFTSFRFKEPNLFRRKTSPLYLTKMMSHLLTVFWIGTLSTEFFPGKFILVVTAAALLISFVLFYRQLETSYRWFERKFLSTFEPQTSQEQSTALLFSHLAPWDAHLVTLELHPNSPLVSRRISEVALRVRYGVNIVAIQRGQKSIVTPLPTEVLLPRDQLVLLGTDEQVEKIRAEFEAPKDETDSTELNINYTLKQARLTHSCPYVGKTIRQSGIREQFHAMVVGIERKGIRTINPDSDFRLAENDVLWIAGASSKLQPLLAALQT